MACQIPKKLVICVTAHFGTERMPYLTQIADEFASLGDSVFVHVFTNTDHEHELEQLRLCLQDKGFAFQVHTIVGLGHPYLLTWSHFAVVSAIISHDVSVTHFLYVEDDILIKRKNVVYWIENEKLLRSAGFIPSFLRVEHKEENNSIWYSTDCTRVYKLSNIPKICIDGKKRYFINLPTPYQGMYLLNRELMLEYLLSPTHNPDVGSWGIREKAAQGITFTNVPAGFTSRNLVPFDVDSIDKINPDCLIHHLPNNYANNPITSFGKISLCNLINVDE